MSTLSNFMKLFRENKFLIKVGAHELYYTSDVDTDGDKQDFEDLVSTIKLLLGESKNGN